MVISCLLLRHENVSISFFNHQVLLACFQRLHQLCQLLGMNFNLVLFIFEYSFELHYFPEKLLVLNTVQIVIQGEFLRDTFKFIHKVVLQLMTQHRNLIHLILPKIIKNTVIFLPANVKTANNLLHFIHGLFNFLTLVIGVSLDLL